MAHAGQTPIVFMTGASGFLGGHVLRSARSLRWRLRCLSRRPPSASNDRRLTWVTGDLGRPGGWEAALEACDVLVHLATMSLADVEKDPVAAKAVMLDGLDSLLTEARRRGVRRYVLASTAEVYGSPRKLPIAESARPRPLSAYGRIKLEAERLAARRLARADASLAVLRFFNLYGPTVDGDVPGTVIRAFAERIAGGQPIVLHASRKNSRDFIHVRDAAGALVRAVQRPAPGGVYNIASGQETTLLELAHRIGSILGAPVEVDFRPHEGRLRRMAGDARLARRRLQFRAAIGLDEGLRELLEALKLRGG